MYNYLPLVTDSLKSASLTPAILKHVGLVHFSITILLEEILVDRAGAKQPDVTVVTDCALNKTVRIQPSALSLGFHWSDDVWYSEQPQ